MIAVRLVVAVGVTALLAEPALARDYYFFNKPGVNREAYLSDRLTCDELAGGGARRDPDMALINTQIWQNQSLTTGQAAAAAGIASFFLGFVAASERRRLVRQIERICLADKGYRRFALNKMAFRAVEKVKDNATRIDGWFTLASAPRPDGKELFE